MNDFLHDDDNVIGFSSLDRASSTN